MHYSFEALTAFVEAAACGSFSAAARRMRKSQSTISTAISNLETDLGLTLFDRSTRQPTLTAQGEQVLGYVKAILAASSRLDALASSLSGNTEPRLTFVLSDTLHPDVLEDLLEQFDRRFPHTEFECLIGEDEDVVDLLQKERAQVGLIEARDYYPMEIGSMRLPLQTAMGIYVAPGHPLASQGRVFWEDLQGWRELRLSTYLKSAPDPSRGQVWSAPNYLLLLSMAVQGFGWCILPCALVEEFAGISKLKVLNISGWPRSISVDLLWNKHAPLGNAGNWLRQHLDG